MLFLFPLGPFGAANEKPRLQPVILNTTTFLELQQVPGIALATADPDDAQY